MKVSNKELDNLKNNCPETIKIEINRKHYDGRITGINSDFAKVYLLKETETSFDVSWECIYRALKLNKPITY